MNGLKAVTELAVYLSKNTTVQVFKHVKTTGFSGEFMVVNNLPFTRGKAVNDMNILNLNVHVPKTSSGTVNSKRLGELQTVIGHSLIASWVKRRSNTANIPAFSCRIPTLICNYDRDFLGINTAVQLGKLLLQTL